MAQETRKDPRAKVLTVTVRYKSATLDEFIEQHSHDVSRGGMFIKTVSPFPAGTLLKIEVRIAGDQRVMQGVGRVVWKRESTEAQDGVPAGMGVKFIKIDDASRGVIDQLVAKSGGAVSAFERGGGESAPAPTAAVAAAAVAAAAATPIPAAGETAKAAARKQTMIGLGGMAGDAVKIEDEKPPAGFFPESEGPPELPAPEDRTVMKQAAELLQDALREAGGSLDEVGTPGASSHPPPPVYEAPRPGKSTSGEHAAAAKGDAAPAKAESPKSEAKPGSAAASSAKSASGKGPPAKPAAAKPASSPRPSQRPGGASPSRRPAISAAESPASEAGSSRFLWVVLAVAAVGGGLFLLTRSPEPAPPAEVKQDVSPPAPTPVEAKTAEPAAANPAPAEPLPPPVALSALPTEDTPPVESAAPPGVKKPKAAALVAPKPPAQPLVPKEPKPVAVPKPPVAATPPATEPKPVAEPKPPAEPKPAPPVAATPPAPEPKPVAEPKAPAEPKPPAEAKPPAEPKPAPAPKPKAPKGDTGDNPY